MLHPLQIRAARALVEMSQQELAQRSGVGLATIKRIEAAGRDLSGTARTLHRIQKALEAVGVVFIDGSAVQGPGVRLCRPLD